MNNGNCSLLKTEFENFKNSIINEGMDEIVGKCFNQVKENINYLNELSFEENISSLNNESEFVERNFKIKETQHLFKYCIMLLEKENNLNPHYKLLLENLLFHFQNIFSSERYEIDDSLRDQPDKNWMSKTSSHFSSISSFIPTSQYIPLPGLEELEKQLLYEQNQELIKLKESANELMDIQKILFNEIVSKQATIDDIQDKIKETTVNTDTFHLMHEINIISEGERRRRVSKVVLYMIVFLILVIIIFRIIF
ncbi:uncharacterized protein cubi_03484 [Cryptosporidium ubiquitum]|uniref:t-SNARE coiled-coil homology domain-containing protein n=1 Tax=Cryptosporidium ubiquitum TaxID=857276 RepID=A0A1J4MHH9_9CRYT|nr:uncharacterized protein cubi_03484 [Cryptosporidium ubiquitum]OII73686.1 hypothetical protein cubi_03484 [Cryptosporidium ubiquitum]